MPTYEIETDQGIFEIDADREPTQAEALNAISQTSLSGSSQRGASVEANIAQNEALRQQNIESALGALPFRGMTQAASQGYQTGQDVLGQNVLGKALGVLFGGVMGAGTALNPISKAAQNVASLVQAGGEALGGQGGQALQSITGERLVLPELQPSAYNTGDQSLNTALNFVSELATQARKDPVSAGLIVQGAKSPQVAQGLRTLPGSIAEAAVRPVTSVRNVVSRLGTTTDDLLAFVSGAEKTPQVFKTRLEEGAFNEVLPDLARAKTLSGVEGVNKARKTLNKETFDVIEPVVKSIDPESVVFNKEGILKKADDKLSLEINTPEVRKSALSTSGKYVSDLTPDNILSRYNDVSDQLITFWKSPDQAKFANRIKGLEAIRSVLSDTIKSSLDERGVDSSIWSKYGKRNELVDQFLKNYGNENVAYKSKRGEGILSKKGVEAGDIISRVPLAGTVVRGVSNLMERATGGTPRALNARIDQLFEGIEPSAPILSTPNLNQLIQQVSDDAQANRQISQRALTQEEINNFFQQR